MRSKRLCLVLFGTILGLGLCEIAVRIRFPKDSSADDVRVSVHEPCENLRLLYRPSPNLSSMAYGVMNHINSYGIRDREFSVEKPEGVTRVVFLGDSVIYGYGIKAGDSVPKRLEKSFRDAGHAVEILNFGVSGYESEQQVEFFKERGVACSPDHVFVGYTLNDSRYASWELHTLDRLFGVEVRDADAGILAAVGRYSRLIGFLDEQLGPDRVPIRRYLLERDLVSADLPDSPYGRLRGEIEKEAGRRGTTPKTLADSLDHVGFAADGRSPSHWNVSARAFRELKELSDREGFEVTVVIIPLMQEMDRYALGSLHRFLAAEFGELGFRVIDPLEEVTRLYLERGPAAVTTDSVHFSWSGAEAFADLLYEETRFILEE